MKRVSIVTALWLLLVGVALSQYVIWAPEAQAAPNPYKTWTPPSNTVEPAPVEPFCHGRWCWNWTP